MKYFISFLLLLLVYSCSTEPIETGPYNNSYYCELNGETYSNSYYHYLYCNPEGVTLYDSLKKESDFIGRYGRFFECRDTINLPHNFPHKYYTLEYNTYNGFFLSDNAFDFKFSRGRKYASNVSGPFLSSENYFLSPVRCVIEYENDNCKCYNFSCVETKLLIQSRVLFLHRILLNCSKKRQHVKNRLLI